jgi:hypothetical protein
MKFQNHTPSQVYYPEWEVCSSIHDESISLKIQLKEGSKRQLQDLYHILSNLDKMSPKTYVQPRYPKLKKKQRSCWRL